MDCSLYKLFREDKESFWNKVNRKIRQILKDKKTSLDPNFMSLIEGMLHHDPN